MESCSQIQVSRITICVLKYCTWAYSLPFSVIYTNKVIIFYSLSSYKFSVKFKIHSCFEIFSIYSDAIFSKVSHNMHQIWNINFLYSTFPSIRSANSVRVYSVNNFKQFLLSPVNYEKNHIFTIHINDTKKNN